MKLEDQLCSLELAKELYELGINKESLFIWKGARQRFGLQLTIDFRDSLFPSRCFENLCETAECKMSYPAYTVAELGDIFALAKPENLLSAYGFVFNVPETKVVTARGLQLCMAKPEIAAKMLIYLIENKLINSSNL